MTSRLPLGWVGPAFALLVVAVIGTTLVRLFTHPAAAPTVAGSSLTTLEGRAFDPSQVQPLPERVGEGDPGISVRAAYLLDAQTGYPLYTLEPTTPVPIASTTKIMTALVVLEQLDLSDIVTVSSDAATAEGSDIDLLTGEQLTVDALLKGLLIQSGNDAAIALGEHVGLEQFVGQMNELAAELGLGDTQFRDPAGLDDASRSTARDLAVLAAYAMRQEVIRGIVQLREATITSVDGRYEHRLETSNRLIKPDHPLFMGEVTGLKTGFTPEAGHCLVATASYQGHELVAVILGTSEDTPEASAKEARRLLNWGFRSFRWSTRSSEE